MHHEEYDEPISAKAPLPESKEPMIEYQSVFKSYADVTAVKDFSCQIPDGSITVFVGSSGCGKTTLLRMINRMVEPTSGTIRIDGEDISSVDAVKLRRRIGYVMQNGGLLPHRTVADNVATVPLLNGASKREAHQRANELLELVGLSSSLAGRYPSQLSGGQQQRVGVARALAAESGILLMDEPFAAVDPIVRRDLQAEVLRLHRELGRTIVFVTHDIDEAFLLGSQVILLRDGGNIAQIGEPEDFITDPANEFVAEFVGLRHRQLRVDGDRVVDADDRLVGMTGAHAEFTASPAGGDS